MLKRMKYAHIVLLIGLIGFTAAAQAPSENASPQAVPTDPENVRKARTLLDQAIKALGGSAYLNIQDVKQEGRSYSFHRGEAKGAGVSFTRIRKLWDEDRIDYTVSAQVDIEPLYGVDIPVKTVKTHVTIIYNGDKGYEITTIGVRNVDEKDELVPYLRRRHFSLDAVLRQWLQEPGVGLFYEGQTVAAQKPVDQITVMNSKNEAVILYLESESHLPIKKTFSWRDPTDKQRNLEEEVFDDYRPIQGVMTPFNDTRYFNGEMSAQSFLVRASYNQNLGEEVFDPHKVVPGKKKY
jgi:hypothetical protein